MADTTLEDLLNQFSKTTVSAPGVSFRGRGLKLDSENDCKDVIEAINKTPDLTYLDLEGNTLGVDAGQAIGNALKDKKHLKRALWKDMFTGRMKTEIPIALRHLGQGLTAAGAMLTELDLSDNAFGPIGVEALADLLQSSVCYGLQELRLNNNGLGITGGKILATALLAAHENSKAVGRPLALKIFIAGRNRLENDGATALSKVFKTLGSLEEISMPQNGIYHKGISQISEALKHNQNLRLLNLNDNTLTAKGAESLAEALPSLQKLKVLNLGDCLLKTKGTLILAEALAQDHTLLEEVLLDSNEIRTDGGVTLVQALKNKKHLKKIGLQGNEFGEAGRSSVKGEVAKLGLGDILDCPSSDDEDASEEEEEQEGSDEEEEGSGEEEESEDGDECTESDSGENASEDEVIENNHVNRTSADPLADFMTKPSTDNFARVKGLRPDNILMSFKHGDGKLDVKNFVNFLMMVSNLGPLSSEVSLDLYKTLFAWAEREDEVTQVNNVLFVSLELIKDEDKLVKVSWNTDRCIGVLQKAIAANLVPSFTQHILTCCLDRKTKNGKVEEIIVP